MATDINKRLPPGNKKGAVRDRETVLKLAMILEREYALTGSVAQNGLRRVVLTANARVIAADLCVSTGTLQNAFRALTVDGFVVSQDGSYVTLRAKPLDEDSMKKLGALAPDPGYQPEKRRQELSEQRGSLPRSFRLSESELTHLYKSVLRSDGVRSAGGVLDWHRKWCLLNGFKPLL